MRRGRSAAEYALRAPAPEEAARLLTTVLAAGQRSKATDTGLAEVLIELATAEYLAGRTEQSLGHCREAAETAHRPDLLANAALVVGGIADLTTLVQTSALCDRALAALSGDSDIVTRSRLLAQRACLDAELERPAAATEASAQAMKLACESGDPVALLDAARARVGRRATGNARAAASVRRIGRRGIADVIGGSRQRVQMGRRDQRVDERGIRRRRPGCHEPDGPGIGKGLQAAGSRARTDGSSRSG
jgi:hypothetical protein